MKPIENEMKKKSIRKMQSPIVYSAVGAKIPCYPQEGSRSYLSSPECIHITIRYASTRQMNILEIYSIITYSLVYRRQWLVGLLKYQNQK